ncbi:uncharacterized protein LOC129570135 [Sitodiplosis mosellana]|uniref:uncharacterized protein LOC129570135 n=1 Tax=Sitodiplosis mosellana TaxID=263140 RepID=UPI0024449AD0|nr:uncharacterized protein LOC129570135 [Sitodiplosis mosellana]
MSVDAPEKNEYPRASSGLVFASIVAYVGSLFLVMSFCSPYWIESYDGSFSSFKKMGLWEYCFKDFYYPNYQFPKKFNGCHNIFSHDYYMIREYLLPGWLLTVQICITLAFILTFLTLGLLALELIRWPLKTVLQYEWLMTKISHIASAVASGMIFLGILIFGFNAYRRDWLMYPKFNIISWSFGLAVVAMALLGAASAMLRREAKRAYEIRDQAKNLVMQMEMQEPGFHPSRSLSRSLHSGGYI